MKRIFVLAAVAMMTAVSAQAQDGYEDTKHEIAVSYGGLSNATWMAFGEDLGTAMISIGKVRYEDGKIFGALGLEYFYHVSPVIGVGAIAAYARETKNLYIANDMYGELKKNYISVMPAVKFNWLRKKYFGMYSKAAIGATFSSKKEEYSKGDFENKSESKVNLDFQASVLGLEAGSPYVRGFVELGVGEQGVFLAGIRCKF